MVRRRSRLGSPMLGNRGLIAAWLNSNQRNKRSCRRWQRLVQRVGQPQAKFRKSRVFSATTRRALGISMNRYSAFSSDPGHLLSKRLQAERTNSSFRAFAELALYDDAPRTVIWAVSTSSGRCFLIAIGHGCCFQSRITQAVPALASSCFFGAGIDKA